MSQCSAGQAYPTIQDKTTVERSAPQKQERLLFFDLPAELRRHIWKLALSDAEPRTVYLYTSTDGNFDEENPTWQLNADIPALLHVCAESRSEALKIYEPSFGSPSLQGHPAYFNGEKDLLFFAPCNSSRVGRDLPINDLEGRKKTYENFLQGKWDLFGDLQSIRHIALDFISQHMLEFFHSKSNDEDFESICYIQDDADFCFSTTPWLIEDLVELRDSISYGWEGHLMTRFSKASRVFHSRLERIGRYPEVRATFPRIISMRFAMLRRKKQLENRKERSSTPSS